MLKIVLFYGPTNHRLYYEMKLFKIETISFILMINKQQRNRTVYDILG